jgi:hypothetical protein
MGKIKEKIERFFLFLSDFKPILLSHHPNCEKFDDHVYHIGKYKLCIGCFTFYPTIILTIIFSILFIQLTFVNLTLMMLFSYLFYIPLVFNLLGLTKYKFLKIFSKISIGIGVGLYILSMILLPFPIIIKILSFFQVNFFVGVIAYIRSNHVKKECKKCKYKNDWDICPGMSNITQKLYIHGFKKNRKGTKVSENTQNS